MQNRFRILHTAILSQLFALSH